MQRFVVARDHPCLPGHFPGQPLVPGVVILDRVIAALESQTGSALGPLRMPAVKFLQPLLPDETADIELVGAAPRWRFRVLRDGVALASGELVAADA